MPRPTSTWMAGGATGGRMVKQGYAYVRAFNGIVRWFDAAGRPSRPDLCPHSHRSPAGARKCAIASAARWNRKGLRPDG